MNRTIKFYFIFSVVLLVLIGCRQAKYVEEGKYLIKSNSIQFKKEKKGEIKMVGNHPQIDEAEMYELIRPEPNRKVKLFFYNRVDTTKMNLQIERKTEKYRKKNKKRQEKEDRINLERIEKAEAKGDSLYRHKVIDKKTLHLGRRHWIQTNLGQSPILMDTAKVRKSSEQMRIFLTKKGFYSATVTDTIIYNEPKQKASVVYTVDAGKPYTIHKFYLDSTSMDQNLLIGYRKFIEEEDSLIRSGQLLDQDVLDKERERFTLYCRDERGMLGFNRNYIGFVVDTTYGDFQADVTLFVKPKTIKDPADTTGKTLVELPHMIYRVREVTFYLHNPDTSSFKDYATYKQRCADLNLKIDEFRGEFPLLDTIKIPYKGVFIFNETPFVEPELLDKQNFLEIDRSTDTIDPQTKYYKEYYVERSYRTLSNLGIFSNITPKVEVDPDDPFGNYVVVSYDLTPIERQLFLFEPGISNTNGILGFQGVASYTNKNLSRKAQELKISFTGGVESQPLIVGIDENGHISRAWQLNTFEWGPKISWSFPKLIPLPKAMEEKFSKRAYPKTILDFAINYQLRTEFKRNLFEFGYGWNFQQDKVQKWEIGIVNINYVKLVKEDFFQTKLDALNDPFLLNSYSDHLTTLFSPVYYYNNVNSNRRKNNNLHSVITSLDISGFVVTPIHNALESLNFTGTGINENGLKEFFGVPFTQFIKYDIQYIGSIYLNRKHKFVYRTMMGMGFAMGNSPSLPYEQAFFAGGSNDIRAFKARTMAPGSYKTYADTNSTTTQIGDSRIEANFEWRFEMTEMLEGAIFVDAGNIWNLRKSGVVVDESTLLKPSSYREIALGVGYGIRADFDFLIVRLDLAVAIHNPHLPAGERWIFSDKSGYKSYFPDMTTYIAPHALSFNFGIGYPF